MRPQPDAGEFAHAGCDGRRGRLFHGVFPRVSPLLGAAARQRDAYRYLPASLEGFPDADRLAGTMRAAGLVGVRYRRFGLGSAAMHVGNVHGA